MYRRSFKMSFRDALSGMGYCLSTQRNMQVHMVVAVAVLVAAWLLKLSRLEWALLLFAISFVMAAEMFNTALERTVDLFVDNYHPLARLAKHIAAGAVLVSALNAAVVGVLIFLPHLRMLIGG
ncbi:MAG: diacylglycerol kinase family protein [Thermacetogeniaceae bacterium]